MVIEPQEAYRSLERGDFVPYFQPYVVLRTGKLKGFEMLARWLHPVHGLISPDEFIPAAERDGWIGALTRDLLREGFAAMSKLPPVLSLSVNISPVQLQDPSLPEQIRCLARAAGFPLSRLKIEVTESALTHKVDCARVIVNKLKAMGCELALDDFGTGYSSLSQLRALPFDALKVDRSFVSSMTEDRENRKIVVAVVGLGQSLGLTTIAEGVETMEEAEMLLWLGCDLGQGWLFGKPVPQQELAYVVAAPRHRVTHSKATGRARRISSSTLETMPAQRFAQLRAIYDGAPVGLAFLDCKMCHVSVNKTMAEMDGVPMEEHLGRTLDEILPDLFAIVKPYLLRALQGEAVPSVEIVKPAAGPNPGQTIVASYQPARDEAGEVIGVQIGVVDVTALKTAEKRRQETEEHFRYMMELLPQMPWVLDAEGNALDVSRRWLELTGTTDEEWRGMGWLNSLHPDDRQPTIDMMNGSFQSGEPMDVKYRVRRADGEWVPMRARGSARLDKNGKIVGWYGSLENLGEIKKHQSDKHKTNMHVISAKSA